MNVPPSPLPSVPSDESRFEEVLAEILRADERGENRDEAAWCALYPDLASELQSFFANRRAIRQVADRLREHELSTQGASEVDGARDRERWPGEGPQGRTFGDYELESVLARGGMGVVYRARQRSLQRTVALKMVLAGRAASPAELARFRQEAEAAARLEHPHIVPVYEVGEQQGQCYYTMKLIEGGNLNAHLDQLRSDPKRAAELVETVARAVHFAHQRGVLHRDLKPANILVDEAGRPHVADFGLARLVDSNDRLTQTGAALGTPGYMAPEQIRGERSITTAVDVYSLGAILFVCLTGKPPFQAERAWETLQAALDSDPPSLRDANSRVDRDLETICRKALEREPGRRYESAAAFAEDLSRWLKNEPIAARPPGLSRRIWKWSRRHPALAVGVAASTLAIMLGGVQLSVMWRAFRGERQANARAESLLYRSLLALAEREWAVGEIYNSREALGKCPEVQRGWEWNYARRLCTVTPASRIMEWPTPIVGGAISANGERICAVDRQGRLWVWDDVGREVATFERAARNGAAQVALSPDGSHVALATGDHASVFKIATRELVWEASASGAPLQLEYSSDGRWLALLSAPPSDGRQSRRLSVWTAQGEPKIDRQLAPSPERIGERFVMASANRVIVYPQITGERDKRQAPPGPLAIDLESGDVATLEMSTAGQSEKEREWPDAAPSALSANGEWLAFVAPWGNSRIELRCVADGRILKAPIASGRPIAYAFSRDGRTMAYGMQTLNIDADSLLLGAPAADAPKSEPSGRLHRQSHVLTVHLVDLETGKEWSVIRGLPGNELRLAFSPDGRRLVGWGGAEAGSDRGIPESFGIMMIWDVPARQTARTLRANDAPISDIALVDGGRAAVAVGEDRMLRAWDVESGRLLREQEIESAATCVAASDDADRVWATAGRQVIEWDLKSGEARRLTRQSTDENGAMNLLGLAVSRDGRRLALAGLEPGTSARQLALPSLRREFTIPDRAQTPSYSRDGRLLAIPYHYDLHGELKIVDARTGRVLHHWKTEPRGSLLRLGWGYLRAAFSPDGRFVAVVGNSGGADVYELSSGKRVYELRGHGTTVWDVAFTSDGTRLATAGYSDNTVKLWSLQTGQEMHTLRGHDASVTAVEFTADDRRLVSADRAGVIRIWEAR